MKRKHLLEIILIMAIGYSVLFLLTRLFFKVIFPIKDISTTIIPPAQAFHILPIFILSILLVFTTLIYLFNSWLEKRWLKINWSKAFLFMGFMAGAGPTGEVIVNSISLLLTHQPLWLYQLLPVHGGNTSVVMSVIWPLYGFHIYCFHNALKARRDQTTDADLAFFVGVDAITLEVLVNVFTISFFYTYIFYYVAGDLYHVSTAVIFIPYVISGYILVKTLHRLEKRHHHIFFGILGFIWSWILIFIL